MSIIAALAKPQAAKSAVGAAPRTGFVLVSMLQAPFQVLERSLLAVAALQRP
jgi:hypothetical protein